MAASSFRQRHPLGRKHDCGTLGKLTVRQIAAAAGLAESTIRVRVSEGVRFEALAAPAKEGPRGRSAGAGDYRENMGRFGSAGATIAFTLVRDFRGREPSIAQIRAHLNCSRATAFRWQKAWREVFGARQLADDESAAA